MQKFNSMTTGLGPKVVDLATVFGKWLSKVPSTPGWL